MKIQTIIPDVLQRLWRNPTESEIQFGYGSIHYTEAYLPAGRKWVKLNGVRWNVCR